MSALLAPWNGALVAPHPLFSAPSHLAPRHQLRAPVQDFVGREAEMTSVRTALLRAAETRSAVAITGVHGMGGIGKTELAYAVAQQVRHAFPDAQIVLALHGTSSSPLTPEQALQTVLRAFLPDSKLPEERPALEALYRTLLDGKRVLILADDACGAAQVQSLLPPPGSALLVTSRVRFVLPAMTTVDLEQLPSVVASELLRTICTRLTADQAVALAHACGYLPLALRVSASLLRITPALAVTDYLAQLADERWRLSSLRDPDEPQRDVAAGLLLSYTQLDAATQAVFRQLGVLVADFATFLARAVVVLPCGEDLTARLYQLQRRNLLMHEAQRDRWRLHDLLRDLARQLLEATGETEAAGWRYARATVQLAAQIQEQYLAGGDMVPLALARFDTERVHIDAARCWGQLHTETPAGDQLLLDIARSTRHIAQLRHDPEHENIPQWERVRAAAKRLGDRDGEGMALNNLGVAYARLGEIPMVISYFEQALAIARDMSDRHLEGRTLSNLGLAYYSLGEFSKAITSYEKSLAITREIGDRYSEGNTLCNLGIAYSRLGELPKAISYYEQRLAIARAIGDRHGEGIALNNLGNTYTDLGDTRHAIECCEAALVIARANGDRQEESYTLSYLARAQARHGDMARASATYIQALILFQEVGDRRGMAECHWFFGLALAQYGERERALPLLHTAVAYEQAIGHAKASEHATLLARLEAGEELPPELR